MSRGIKRSLLLLTVVLALTPGADATWSILIVDTRTGEIAVGSATCLTGLDLERFTPVILPGIGAATAQSFIDQSGANRLLIRNQLLMGTSLPQILALLALADPGHQTRQYGMVDATGATLTFTGTGAGSFAAGLTGQIGDLFYAVQGNVLTGLPVITAAEQAILSTPGDLSQKLLAAMEAARSMGGDGRCSCSPINPTGCGSPPPNFTKSADIGFMIVTRQGDTAGGCGASLGCATGDYFMNLNVANQQAGSPDPVLQLQGLYTVFRNSLIGRPDHHLSTLSFTPSSLPSDGVSSSTATLQLVDVDGTQITTGGANVTVMLSGDSEVSAQIGAVSDHGDGTYSFDVTAGPATGTVRLTITVDDGQGPVLLSPRSEIQIVGPLSSCATGNVGDGSGGPFDLLKINGSAGIERVVAVGQSQPVLFSMDAPPGAATFPLPPIFAVFGRTMLPGPSDAFTLPFGIGELCFLPDFATPDPAVFALVNGFGPTPPGLFSATVAPWTAAVPGGIPFPVDLALQGLIIGDSLGQIAVTNAVVLRVLLLPPPSIDTVDPISAAPGATVTITGTGFQVGATVTLGGISVLLDSVTPSVLTFTAPAGVPCDGNLVVSNVDGQNGGTIFNPTPTILSTILPQGPAAGNAFFIVTGTGFSPGMTVTIGGALATVNSATTGSGTNVLSLTTPPGTPGSATVLITSSGGCSATTSYTYN